MYTRRSKDRLLQTSGGHVIALYRLCSVSTDGSNRIRELLETTHVLVNR
jgi:hypothetical protein